MDEPKVAVLRHYASPYYDPQKAHEYYMRTRELKGRSTTSLNDEGTTVMLSRREHCLLTENLSAASSHQSTTTILLPLLD